MKCAKRKKDSLGPSSLSNNDNNASINPDQFGEEDDEDRKRKKVRTTFTGRQIFELEKMFEDKKYLSSTERAEMARMLNVTEQQVSCQVVAKTDSRNTLIFLYLQLPSFNSSSKSLGKDMVSKSSNQMEETRKYF